jgi:hypothetical protein
MNYLPLLKNAMTAARSSYEAEEINAEQMAARAKRISGLIKVAGELQRRKESRTKFLERTSRHLAMVRDAMNDGVRIVSIDTGFHPETEVLQEVGITIWDGNYRNTVTYIVAGQEKDRDTDKANAILPLEDLRKLVQAHYDDAFYVVFHQAYKDIELLELNTKNTRYFDTSFISQRWFAQGGSPKLTTLCRHYGVKFAGAHQSGEDSRMALEVLFAMAMDTTKPVFYLKKGQP